MPYPLRPYDSIEELHEHQLIIYRDMWHREIAIFAALQYCTQNNLIAPPWLISESAKTLGELLSESKAKKRGRSNGPLERYRQDMIDYERKCTVDEVREMQETLPEDLSDLEQCSDPPQARLLEIRKLIDWVGHDLDRAFECASMRLQGTDSHGGPDAVKASYLRVKKGGNAPGALLRYHIVPNSVLASLGIAPKKRVRKFTPLYDLTL